MLATFLKGAVSASQIQYIGSVKKAAASEVDLDTSGEALNVLSIAQTGDLVVIAFTFESNQDSTWSWAGMSFTAINNQTGQSNPGAYVGYRFVQSGDSNPYVINTNNEAWKPLPIVASVFRNVNSYVSGNSAVSVGTMPNPPSLTANGNLWIATGHMVKEAFSTWTAPTNYTLADYETYTPPDTRTAIAYRIASLTSDDPGVFGGSDDKEWRATTAAFS